MGGRLVVVHFSLPILTEVNDCFEDVCNLVGMIRFEPVTSDLENANLQLVLFIRTAVIKLVAFLTF